MGRTRTCIILTQYTKTNSSALKSWKLVYTSHSYIWLLMGIKYGIPYFYSLRGIGTKLNTKDSHLVNCKCKGYKFLTKGPEPRRFRHFASLPDPFEAQRCLKNFLLGNVNWHWKMLYVLPWKYMWVSGMTCIYHHQF